jgi:hypothetical protein
MLRVILVFVLFAAAALFVCAGDDQRNRTPTRIPGKQPAPDFEDIEAWINGPPQSMADLKGKVVVVHFMAFG